MLQQKYEEKKNVTKKQNGKSTPIVHLSYNYFKINILQIIKIL